MQHIKCQIIKNCQKIISQKYHLLKNDIKISISSKKWYDAMILYQWYYMFQCLRMAHFDRGPRLGGRFRNTFWPSISGLWGRRRTYLTILELVDNALFIHGPSPSWLTFLERGRRDDLGTHFGCLSMASEVAGGHTLPF
jgi:hypothetical protein